MRFYCPCVFIFHRKSGLQIVLAVRRPGDADYSDWAEQGGFMKLQTRIMVGFFMIILVPLLLFAATLHGMREAQIRGPKKAETAETASSEYDYDYGITIADSETSQDGIQIMTKDLFVSATGDTCIYQLICGALDLQEYCHSSCEAAQGNQKY